MRKREIISDQPTGAARWWPLIASRAALRRARRVLLLGAVLCATSQLAPAAAAATYSPPRNEFGQPDLGTYWANASLTPESRPAGFGDRLVYTPAEAAKIEGGAAKFAAAADRPTDPHASATARQALPSGAVTPPQFQAGAGNVGGYNYAWLDPGSRVMRVDGQPRTSILTTPDGRAPTPRAGAVVERFDIRNINFNNPENRTLGERCILGFGRNAGPPMLANGFYNNDYEFVQGEDTIAIDVEMVHDIRLIRLGGTHRTDGLRPYMGDSIGHWEGNTLVVETTNIPKAQAYHGSWKNLTVTERFTRVAEDRLLYQFTVNDPTIWDKPWGGEYEFSPLKGIIYEYACHEGNYALEDMLAGARAQEANAQAAPPTQGGPATH
jgi:hypothetical protein